MLAARYATNGPAAEVLRPTDLPLPEPGEGEVRVRMVASPIHNHDLIIIAGGYGVTPGLPATGGSEALGIVDKLGAGVTGLKPGDRVIAAGLNGAWAEFYLAGAERLVPVPDALPDDLAAQIAGMPVDSLIAFNNLGAQKGEWLVVNAANGAVGKAIMQIGKSRGVRVAGLVHRAAAKRDLEAQGFADVFVTEGDGWVEALRGQIGAARVAGGIDMVGGPVVGQMVGLLGPGAVLLVMGAMSGQPIQIDAGPMIFGELSVRGFWGAKEAGRMTATQIRALIEELIALGVAGRFDLPVAQSFPLSQVAAATAAAWGSARNGKVLLRPDARG